MYVRLEELGVSKEELGCGRLEAGSPRETVAWTPLQYACALGDAELVSGLIAANPEAVNAVGNTKYAYSPLHIAVRFEHEAIVKLLLAIPPTKVNAVDSQVGCTSLHLAILQGNHSIVKILLDDANIQQLESKNGTTPVELADELQLSSDIQALLVSHAARASSRAQLASWLASIGLVEYAPTFFDEGFDDANFLLGTGTIDDKTLDAMHIQKAGHRAKLQSLYKLKEFLHVESNENEDSVGSEEDESGSSGDSDEDESDSDDSGSDDDSS